MSTAQIIHLSEADPRISPDELIDGLVPPPQFEDVSFASYRPDPTQPSQSEARDTLKDFVSSGGGSSRLLGRLFGGGKRSKAKGVYLDGGYGVGKTHLLASTWHASEKPATFGTFVEYTNLIGRWASSVRATSSCRRCASSASAIRTERSTQPRIAGVLSRASRPRTRTASFLRVLISYLLGSSVCDRVD